VRGGGGEKRTRGPKLVLELVDPPDLRVPDEFKIGGLIHSVGGLKLVPGCRERAELRKIQVTKWRKNGANK